MLKSLLLSFIFFFIIACGSDSKSQNNSSAETSSSSLTSSIDTNLSFEILESFENYDLRADDSIEPNTEGIIVKQSIITLDNPILEQVIVSIAEGTKVSDAEAQPYTKRFDINISAEVLSEKEDVANNIYESATIYTLRLDDSLFLDRDIRVDIKLPTFLSKDLDNPDVSFELPTRSFSIEGMRFVYDDGSKEESIVLSEKEEFYLLIKTDRSLVLVRSGVEILIEEKSSDAVKRTENASQVLYGYQLIVNHKLERPFGMKVYDLSKSFVMGVDDCIKPIHYLVPWREKSSNEKDVTSTYTFENFWTQPSYAFDIESKTSFGDYSQGALVTFNCASIDYHAYDIVAGTSKKIDARISLLATEKRAGSDVPRRSNYLLYSDVTIVNPKLDWGMINSDDNITIFSNDDYITSFDLYKKTDENVYIAITFDSNYFQVKVDNEVRSSDEKFLLKHGSKIYFYYVGPLALMDTEIDKLAAYSFTATLYDENEFKRDERNISFPIHIINTSNDISFGDTTFHSPTPGEECIAYTKELEINNKSRYSATLSLSHDTNNIALSHQKLFIEGFGKVSVAVSYDCEYLTSSGNIHDTIHVLASIDGVEVSKHVDVDVGINTWYQHAFIPYFSNDREVKNFYYNKTGFTLEHSVGESACPHLIDTLKVVNDYAPTTFQFYLEDTFISPIASIQSTSVLFDYKYINEHPAESIPLYYDCSLDDTIAFNSSKTINTNLHIFSTNSFASFTFPISIKLENSMNNVSSSVMSSSSSSESSSASQLSSISDVSSSEASSSISATSSSAQSSIAAITRYSCSDEPLLKSPAEDPTDQDAYVVTVVNTRPSSITMYWIDDVGERNEYATIAPNESLGQGTYRGDIWVLTDADGRCLDIFVGNVAKDMSYTYPQQ